MDKKFINLWIAVFGVLAYIASLGKCVQWSHDALDTSQGDDVTVSCTTALEQFNVLRVVWMDEHDSELVIAEDSSMKDAFKKTGRYAVAFSAEGEEGTTTISYTGITGDDAGRLCCYTIKYPDDKACIRLEVKVPVKSINIITIAASNAELEIAPDDNVLLMEGRDMGVACVAETEGSDDAPQMTLKMGDNDVTSEFQVKLILGESLTNGLLTELPKRGNTHRMEYRTTNPSPDFNGQHLECIAEQPGGSKSITVNLDVEYSPILTCSAYEYFSQHDASVRFTCDLRANPGATVSWSYTAEGDQQADIANHPGNASIRAHEEPVSADHAKVTLDIPAVEASHFTRYFIDATNDIGEKTLEITLTEGMLPVETIKPIIEIIPMTSTTPAMEEEQTEAITEKEQHVNVVTLKGTGKARPSTQDENSATSVYINIVTLAVSTLFVLFWKSTS